MTGFAIGIRYLAGRSVATDPSDRSCAEWPPHPARVFMAMAAAHFQTPRAAPELNEERAALEWLEEQAPPHIWFAEAEDRVPVTAFVPPNDESALTKATTGTQSLPGIPRLKQPRTFPSVTIQERTDGSPGHVYLAWPDASIPREHAEALDGLCTKVTRIGHSASMVQVWVEPEPPEPTLVPADNGDGLRVRIVTEGTLGELEERFPGLRPAIGTWQGYAKPATAEPAVPGSIWDPDLLILGLEPQETRFPRLDAVSVLQVAHTMHKAVVACAAEPVPEFVSGHDAEGSPSQRPHLAYFPVGFVGSPHADGHLMGIAVAVPRELNHLQRRRALRAVAGVESLTLGPLGLWRLSPVEQELRPYNLRSETWTGSAVGSRHWGTVTPVAYDSHPKAKAPDEYWKEVADMVCRACERIGLPPPAEVIPTPVSPHIGVPAAHVFPRIKRKDGSERRHTHAILVFEEPVRGPVAIGAGRYRGFGLCRPIRGEEATG